MWHPAPTWTSGQLRRIIEVTLTFLPLQSFFHSFHHSSVWKDWVLQANRLIVSNCWQFFLTVQLHPPICLSIQVILEFLNGVSCVFICMIWYFIFAWNNVSYLCNINVLYLCDITFYILLPAVKSVRVGDTVPGIILLGRSGVKRGMKNSLCVKVWCHCDRLSGMSVMVFPSHRAGCPHGWGGDSLDPPTQVTMHWLVGDICIILRFVFVWCVICICVMWHLNLRNVTFVFVWGDTQPTYTGHHAPASRRCVLHNETQTVTVEYPWWWSCWFWSSSLADSRTSSFFVRYQQKKWYVCRIFWLNFCFQTERLWENKWLTKPSNWESANPLQNCFPPKYLAPWFHCFVILCILTVFQCFLLLCTFLHSNLLLLSNLCQISLPLAASQPWGLLRSTSARIPKAWS